MNAITRNVRTPLCDTLGIVLPIVLAGMGGVSWPRLVAAASNAGGLGVHGAADLDPAQIREIKSRTEKRLDSRRGILPRTGSAE